MGERVQVQGLDVDRGLHDLVVDEVLPGTGLSADGFWRDLARLVAECTPRNRALLARREQLQEQVATWHRLHGPGTPDEVEEHLRSIGYLVDDGSLPATGTVTTSHVDRELASVAGPQLVVPVDNARYALNAANARWGSLYDALYGTDAMGSAPPDGPYDPGRGEEVVAWVRAFLDDTLPLADGSWSDATGLAVREGALAVDRGEGDEALALADPAALVGWQGAPDAPSAVLLVHHGLHVHVVLDRLDQVGAADAAGIADVELEAAVTTIADMEDSVAVVDAVDKVRVYRNWLGLMRGDLTADVSRGGETFTRSANDDRSYDAPDGGTRVLPGRSVLLVRHVGLHMTTPAVLAPDGTQVHEGLLDALVASACALHDVGDDGRRANSRTGSVYVVKPKLHGPEEVAFAVDVLARVEDALRLPARTLKIGVMDEERRTTVNLASCVAAAADRIVFVNTGFLDRTGDEIHTVMAAGPVVPPEDMRDQPWIDAYERWNVDVALAAGLPGHGQVGKGMWAMPDRMAAMLDAKQVHPEAGASTAWVPSPTAAVLHALHYHRVDVAAVQAGLADRAPAALHDLLTVPVLDGTPSDDEVDRALRNACQGILGYVVRWVDEGVGCSTVPDVDDVGRMEDRATLRISSQFLASWLRHGVVDEARVLATMQEMAAVVDRQNADDPSYVPMADDLDGSVAFAAARDLVWDGRTTPGGYTEPVLHPRRRQRKAAAR